MAFANTFFPNTSEPLAQIKNNKNYIWPTQNPILVLKPFQQAAHPWLGGHTGIDIFVPDGSLLLAPGYGRIWFAGKVAGREVITLEVEGMLISFDAATTTLNTGEVVAKGQIFGISVDHHCGNNCLHLGLRVSGNYLNPLLLFQRIPYSEIKSRSLNDF